MPTEVKVESITRGSILARNGVFNLVGQGVPLLVALFAIPLLIRGLGTERFGILTLVWMIIGYFSLFDLGLGRALTQTVAEKTGAEQEAELPSLVWTVLVLMFVTGLVGAIVVGAVSPWLVHSVLKIPAALQPETLSALYFLAASIPVVIVTAGLSGLLAALQRFGTLNAIRIPMGIFSLLAPLLIVPFSVSLSVITAVLVIGRLAGCVVHLAFCMRAVPLPRAGFSLRTASIKPLLRFGAWMSVTSVVGPLMVYLDRFVIGSLVSVAAVAYYATPYEMVTKLWIIPAAIAGVLFPALAASFAQNPDRTAMLLCRGVKYVALALFPVTLLIAAFAFEGLRWWLGDEFAQHGTSVLQWLAIGVFINSIAMVFMTHIQAIGRPDLSAKVHLLELPLYLLLLWWAVLNYGILGVAIAWTGRVAFDAGVLSWMSLRLLGRNTALRTRAPAGLLLAIAGLATPLMSNEFSPRAALVLFTMVAFLCVAWFFVLGPDERKFIRYRVS